MSYSIFFYQCKIKDVVDWNTLDIEMDLGFNISHSTRIRLHGVKTPDPNAHDYVKDWVQGHKQFFIRTFIDNIGDYARTHGVIYADETANVCLNAQLIDAGLAQPDSNKER